MFGVEYAYLRAMQAVYRASRDYHLEQLEAAQTDEERDYHTFHYLESLDVWAVCLYDLCSTIAWREDCCGDPHEGAMEFVVEIAAEEGHYIDPLEFTLQLTSRNYIAVSNLIHEKPYYQLWEGFLS